MPGQMEMVCWLNGQNGIVSFASWLFWAGADLKELSMGFGYRKGPVIWDFGFALEMEHGFIL